MVEALDALDAVLAEEELAERGREASHVANTVGAEVELAKAVEASEAVDGAELVGGDVALLELGADGDGGGAPYDVEGDVEDDQVRAGLDAAERAKLVVVEFEVRQRRAVRRDGRHVRDQARPQRQVRQSLHLVQAVEHCHLQTRGPGVPDLARLRPELRRLCRRHVPLGGAQLRLFLVTLRRRLLLLSLRRLVHVLVEPGQLVVRVRVRVRVCRPVFAGVRVSAVARRPFLVVRVRVRVCRPVSARVFVFVFVLRPPFLVVCVRVRRG
mmetsp:Transcript_7178/g.21898  ORF Transcript_7178/g.21898 Transcript_7178/m.21898 type:complete len:269 (+) Transcript_7178:603-1409(+)